MPLKYRKRFNKKSVKKVTKSDMKSPVNLNQKIKHVVRQESSKLLKRRLENKDAYLQQPANGTTYTSFNNNIDTNDFYSIMPAISQGVTSAGRIGNSIDMKGLYVKGLVNILFPPNIAGVQQYTSPTLWVRIMCVEDKSSLGTGVTNSQLLTRNGVNTSFQGSPQDLYTAIDKNRYIVHYDKKIMIQNPSYTVGQTGYINANIQTTKYFSFKIGKRTVTYDNNGASTPVKFNPQICFAFIDPSINVGINSSTLACQFTFNSTCYYEDS